MLYVSGLQERGPCPAIAWGAGNRCDRNRHLLYQRTKGSATVKASGKLTKTEVALLALTVLFLLCTAVTFALRAAQDRTDYVITAAGNAALAEEPEEEVEEETPALPVPTAEDPLNINEAGEAELDQLPEIGPVLAERIVAYRAEHGPFARVEDLMNVEGIGEVTFEKIRELVTVGEAAA